MGTKKCNFHKTLLSFDSNNTSKASIYPECLVNYLSHCQEKRQWQKRHTQIGAYSLVK